MVLQRLCPGCRRPASAVCPNCAARLEPAPLIVAATIGVDRVIAVHRYDSLMARIVPAAKNGNRADLLRWLALAMADLYRSTETGPGTGTCTEPGPIAARPEVVAWIPAARHHRRRRGFDQGRRLAAEVADALGLDHRPLLMRRRGEAQGERDSGARRLGPELLCPRPAPPAVLLVDDVVTTGSSLARGAAALRCSGAESVTALVAASAH